MIYIILIILLLNTIFSKHSNILGCGLVGFSGVNKFDPGAIRLLLLENESRGRHSCGLYSPINNLQKKVGPIGNNLKNFKIQPDNIFLGHTRHATIGAHTVENQHPFEVGNIVGMHNGSLTDIDELANLYGISTSEYNTDSQLIYKIINKTKNINVARDLKGAAALMFTDKKNPDKLYVIRNSARPLHFGKINGDMYISSEKEPLEKIGAENIREFKTETIYTIEKGVIIAHSKVKMQPINYINTNTVHTTSNRNIISAKSSDIFKSGYVFRKVCDEKTNYVGFKEAIKELKDKTGVEFYNEYALIKLKNTEQITLYRKAEYDILYNGQTIKVDADLFTSPTSETVLYFPEIINASSKTYYCYVNIPLVNTKNKETICKKGDYVELYSVQRNEFGKVVSLSIRGNDDKIYLLGDESLFSNVRPVNSGELSAIENGVITLAHEENEDEEYSAEEQVDMLFDELTSELTSFVESNYDNVFKKNKDQFKEDGLSLISKINELREFAQFENYSKEL